MDIVTILIAAASAGAAQAAEAPPAEQPRERQICRRVSGATASRMGPRRVCKTAAEWAATARSSESEMGLADGMDPRAHNPTSGDCGGMCQPTGPR